MQNSSRSWFSTVERLVVVATTISVLSFAGGILLDRTGGPGSSLFDPPLAAFTSSTNPAVLGEAAVSSTLTVVPGVWTPTPERFSYRWYSSDQLIEGATASTYVVSGSDAGDTITVTVTASRAGYDDLPQSSRPTATVLAGSFSAAPNPSIAGSATVGSTLTAVTDGWSPAPTSFSYKWFSSGTPVQEGPEPTYVITDADVGKKVTLTVTAMLDGYTPVPKSSGALPTVPPVG